MAAVQQQVGSAIAVISGLTDGTRYQAQNVGAGALRFITATAAPSDRTSGFYIPVYGEFWFHKVVGEQVYVWAAGYDTEIWYDEIQTD